MSRGCSEFGYCHYIQIGLGPMGASSVNSKTSGHPSMRRYTMASKMCRTKLSESTQSPVILGTSNRLDCRALCQVYVDIVFPSKHFMDNISGTNASLAYGPQ